MRAVLTAVVAHVLLSTGDLSAKAPAADEDIRGPKALVEIPRPEKPHAAFWLGVGGGALVLGMAAWLWHRRRRRQQRMSPRQIALAALAELEAKREVMAAEAFGNRAALVVRQYIADHFGLAAPRRTTEEFLHDLATREGSALLGESDHLRVFLKACDLAKFAASPLDASERGELIQAARDFIAATSAPGPASQGRPAKGGDPGGTQPAGASVARPTSPEPAATQPGASLTTQPGAGDTLPEITP